MIPGVKSLLYIGSLLAVWQVNVKEEKLIVKEVIKKKKRKGGGSKMCYILVYVISYISISRYVIKFICEGSCLVTE